MLKEEIIKQVIELNEDELRSLHKVIIERIRVLQHLRNAVSSAKLSVGDRVYFYSKKLRSKVYGSVLKINRSAIRVRIDDKTLWDVSATLLTKVE